MLRPPAADPRCGFWTASPKRGTMGFGITHDGVAWEALPSPTMVPPLGGEVGAVEYIRYGPGLSKGGYYALLGTGAPPGLEESLSPTHA